MDNDLKSLKDGKWYLALYLIHMARRDPFSGEPDTPGEVKILGFHAHVSVIPYWIPLLGPFKRENNWFIFKFREKMVPVGASFLIVEWKEDEKGEFSWQIVHNSPMQNCPELLEAAGRALDKHYASFYEKAPDQPGL